MKDKRLVLRNIRLALLLTVTSLAVSVAVLYLLGVIQTVPR